MLDKKQLKKWEKLCDKESLCECVFEDFGVVFPRQSKKLTYAFADKAMEIIPELIAEVRRLNKEADWFAMHLAKTQPMIVWSEKRTAEMWREAAREAASDD